jgi:hypothetical protein
MKPKHSILFIFVTLLVCVLGLIVLGQQRTNVTSTESFSKLSLRLAPSKQEFLPFEPIPLTIILKNDSSDYVTGHSQIGFKEKYLKLLVRNESGQEKELTSLSPVSCKCDKPRNKQISPGQSFQTNEIFFNLHNAFPMPGSYQIQAVFRDANWVNETKSKPITIKIIEPVGVDLEASNFLEKQMKGHSFVFAGLGREQVYNDLTMRFPGTLYADYATYFLGSKYLTKGEYERADPLLRQALQRKDLVFREEAIKQLKKVDQLRSGSKLQ